MIVTSVPKTAMAEVSSIRQHVEKAFCSLQAAAMQPKAAFVYFNPRVDTKSIIVRRRTFFLKLREKKEDSGCFFDRGVGLGDGCRG